MTEQDNKIEELLAIKTIIKQRIAALERMVSCSRSNSRASRFSQEDTDTEMLDSGRDTGLGEEKGDDEESEMEERECEKTVCGEESQTTTVEVTQQESALKEVEILYSGGSTFSLDGLNSLLSARSARTDECGSTGVLY